MATVESPLWQNCESGMLGEEAVADIRTLLSASLYRNLAFGFGFKFFHLLQLGLVLRAE